VIIGIALAKNAIARGAISGGVTAMTGLGLHIDAMDVGLLRSAIGIRGLEVHNPKGFPEPVMVSMPELYVDYDLGAFVRGQVHLEEVRLNLEELVVIRDAQGRLNLDALRAISESKRPQEPAAREPAKGAAPDIRVDALELKIGTVIFRDYSKGSPPKVQEFTVNINERHEGITNPTVLAGLIVSRALMKTTIAKLTDFDLDALQGQLDEQMARALATAGVSRATEAGQAVLGAAGEQFKGATDSLRKVLPLGKDP